MDIVLKRTEETVFEGAQTIYNCTCTVVRIYFRKERPNQPNAKFRGLQKLWLTFKCNSKKIM